MVRVLNVLLLLIIIVGVYFVTQAGLTFEATRNEYARLTAKVGRLPIKDATKVHVLALETNDPLDFAWQVYLPAKFSWQWETAAFQSGTSRSTSTSQESRMDIVCVRFRKIDDRWYVWTRMFGSSGVAGFGDLELFDQPKLLQVQQLGVGKVRVIEPDEVVTLLRVSAKQPSDAEDREQVPFVGRFGSQSAWTKQQSKGG